MCNLLIFSSYKATHTNTQSYTIGSRKFKYNVKYVLCNVFHFTLFICRLFKGDFKSSHYLASNGWMLVNNVLQIMYKEVVFG